MDKETAVRQAARDLYDCDQRVSALQAMNTPTDSGERRVAFEELKFAEAEAERAYMKLLAAKSNFVRSK